MFASLALVAAATASQTYRGFTIDTSAVADQPDLAAIVAATHEQIDMVQAVGFPGNILAFLQSVEFKVVPSGKFKTQSPGRYTGRGRRVEVSAGIVRVGHKPVLLHELMHAYHDQQLEQGLKNPAVLALYEKARSIPAFAAKSHMMANPSEYFACSATAYLFGVTAQEPFTREKLRGKQPACLDFLHSLFGANAGKYQGSLTRGTEAK
ncbi:MAG TPA: hypothetical protein VG734_27020 [Lacunisphaera sp.]|nr:hypothetical protein [Lacunisphaera sp.]